MLMKSQSRLEKAPTGGVKESRACLCELGAVARRALKDVPTRPAPQGERLR